MVGRVTLNSSAICWTGYLRLRRRRFPHTSAGRALPDAGPVSAFARRFGRAPGRRPVRPSCARTLGRVEITENSAIVPMIEKNSLPTAVEGTGTDALRALERGGVAGL